MKAMPRAVCPSFVAIVILCAAIEIERSTQTPVYAGNPHAPNEHPVYQGGFEWVYVCGRRCSDPEQDFGPIGYDFDTVTGTAYAPQVLANEWHWLSQDQALRAGAVAIHTFAHREIGPGCGAVLARTHNLPWPPFTSLSVENSWSQSYWLNPAQQTGQNTITQAHRDAVNDTLLVRVFRSDWDYACAKYFANCGNPTASSSLESETLVSVPDPVDSNNAIGTHQPGMSQNATHAWELTGYAGAAPWDYRQMLTHYYAHVRLSGADYNYRWAWLDVTPDIRFHGTYGEDYYGPLSHTPTTMLTGMGYNVQMRIQNTGNATWSHGGSNPVRLSYHWYDSSGQNVIT
ncbi:MAG: hypothetical protein NUW24_01840 [Anaerolineae bacterium]|jgi:hypothetical protein|nr:hypothetical protein [Anaerolineae bacterium]MDH7473143.1 hypothetical protein [Anaerolineae bacterium]